MLSAYIAHLEGLHLDFKKRCNDPLKMDYAPWFVNLENYESGDENVGLAEMSLDLKENVNMKRVDKESVFIHKSVKDSHPYIFHISKQASFLSLPHGW